MFRLLRMVFFIVIGIYIGFQLSLMNMRGQCANASGYWTGAVCMEKDPNA